MQGAQWERAGATGQDQLQWLCQLVEIQASSLPAEHINTLAVVKTLPLLCIQWNSFALSGFEADA